MFWRKRLELVTGERGVACDSGHGIGDRPSNLMAKVSAVLGWFERYR